MLAAQQDFRSELYRLVEGIDDRDLQDGAGQVILGFLKNVGDKTRKRTS
jgi:hypothetical protein